MLKIAICDDDSSVCSEIERIVLAYQIINGVTLETEVFLTGEELFRYLTAGNYFDLIFLDIEMPAMDGVEVGHHIREGMRNQTTQIVYVSGRENYFKSLFAVRPMNFIDKPISQQKIFDAVTQAMELSGVLNETFCYKVSHETSKLAYKEIVWFETDGRRIRIVKTVGDAIFYGEGLDMLEKRLAGRYFIRIHRAFIVNYAHVAKFTYTQLTMTEGTVLPISKTYQKAVRSLQIQLGDVHNDI